MQTGRIPGPVVARSADTPWVPTRGEALQNAAEAFVCRPARERSRLLMMAAVVSAAIVLHNIPEGMAVAGPLFAATKNRGKAVLAAIARA